jgi:uncharacterized protein (TIGR02996 family)
MSEADALLAAVVAAPDDDLPRLVLADWHEEHGDPGYAAFVRTQVALAAADPWEPVAVRVRTFDPDAVTGRPWLDTLPPAPYGAGWVPDRAFRRGFGWAVRHQNLLGLLESGGELFDRAPVGELHLPTATWDEWGAVARSAWLPRVRAVRFFGTKTPVEPLRAFAASPLSTGLEAFDFQHAGGAGFDEVFAGLMDSPVGGRVRALAFHHGDRWLADLLDALLAGPVPPPLDRLALHSMRVTEAEAARLADCPAVDRLTDLELTTNPLAGGLRPLVESPRLRHLRSLAVRGCRLTPEDVAAIAAAPFAPTLRRLDLGHNPLDPEAVTALAGGRLSGLRSLRLRRCGLGDASVWPLAGAAFWGNLVELDLGENWLTDAGARSILDAPVPADLTAVRLDGNEFPAELVRGRRSPAG